jgi:trk system potassium uptake protein TrkH
MTPFEAFCHSFATVSTGGFSTRDASVLAFASVYIEAVVTVFMFLGGANFALHYWLLRGQWRRYWKNEEFRLYTYVTIAAIVALSIAAQIQAGETLLHSIRIAAFQGVSIITTTGFMSSDYLLWGFASQMIILILLFLGGSSGSTAGGLKMMRLDMLGKHFWRGLKRVLHPRAVYTIRHSGTIVTDEVMMNVLAFFAAYVGVFVFSSVLLTGMGVDLLTSMSAAASTLGNVGPGLNEVGPATNYGGLPLAGKLLLSFCMLLGRLEIFTMLIVATPMFWRRV